MIASGAPQPVTTQTLLTAAIDYSTRHRWAVLPLHSTNGPGRCTCPDPACESQGKHPRTEHGFEDATTDEAIIRKWWGKWRNANVGVRTGAASGIGVLDVDPRHGGMESLAQLEARIGDLFPTPTARTGGGGLHFFFAHPGGYVPCKVNLGGLQGLDFRSDGGYVCVTPSLHKSGNAYRWEAAPDEIDLQPLPAGLLEIINANGHAPGQPRPRLDVASILDGVPHGARDVQVFRLACKMRGADVPEAFAEHLVLEAAANARPPFDADRAREKVRRAYATYGPGAAPAGTEATRASESDDLVFADLTAAPRPTPPALVGRDGQTPIAAGNKVAVVADAGTGKTHLLVPLGIGISAGRDVMGFACAQQPVIYISSDDDPDFIRKFQRHAAGLGIDLAGLPLRVLDDPAFNLDEPGNVGRIGKALRDLGADKVPATFIVESLSTNVLPGQTDLYDGVSVRAFVRRTLASLQADFPGLTCIISHHLKKSQAGGANDLSSRVSGSVQIRAGMDCVIGLVPDGPEAFTVRTLKRSRSGARFDAFKVRIVGENDDPLTLKNDGTIDVSDTELQGASGAVVAFLKAAGGPRPLKAIVAGVSGFRSRAIQTACRKLSEGESPRLVRTGIKPASYAYAPPKQTDLDLVGLD